MANGRYMYDRLALDRQIDADRKELGNIIQLFLRYAELFAIIEIQIYSRTLKIFLLSHHSTQTIKIIIPK